MKILIAPDSFKGSLTAREAARAIERGVRLALPAADTLLLPVADGGEGTLDALVPPENRISVPVVSACGEAVTAQFGSVNGVAVIEMAAAAGLCLVPESRRNAGKTTTYGVGQLISAALGRGFRRLLITVGGSATNDGGTGMLEALGAEFYGGNGEPLTGMCGEKLALIEKINTGRLDPRLRDCELTFACDVTNPLTGPNGATLVYGAQKGADRSMLDRLELGMQNYALRLAGISRDISGVSGCGAGGGLPAPFTAIFGAGIRSGIASVLSALDFEAALDGVSLVITGEGRIDGQSAFGKAVGGVAAVAARHGIPVTALAGQLGNGAEQMKRFGVTDMYAIADIAPTPDAAFTNAASLLSELARRVCSR